MENDLPNRSGVCKFCLTKCDNVEILDRTTRDSLGLRLLNTNSAVNEELVMCPNCSERVTNCLTFKRMCLRTFGTIVPFHNENNSPTMSLKDIYVTEYEAAPFLNYQDVCCLCMDIKNYAISIKNEGAKVYDKMFEKCLPELDYNIIDNPTICAACHMSLEDYFNFLVRFFLLEEKSKPRRKIRNVNYNISLDLTGDTVTDILRSSNINIVDILFREDPSIKFIEDKCASLEERCEFQKFEDVPCTSKSVLSTEETRQRNEYSKRRKALQHFLFSGIEYNMDQDEVYRFEDGVRDPSGNWKDSSEMKYRCDTCTYRTKEEAALKLHEMVHEKPLVTTLYQCYSCSFQAKKRSALRVHRSTHKNSANVIIYKCTSCRSETKYRMSRSTKRKDTTQIMTYQCESCSLEAQFKSDLARDELTPQDTSAVVMRKCKICLFQTTHESIFKKHSLEHEDDPSEETMYECDVCAFQTDSKPYISKHMLVHKKYLMRTTHYCEFCTFKAKHKNTLKIHLMVHKDPSEVLMYKCNFCLYQTKDKSELKRHNFTHRQRTQGVYGTRMFKCSACSYQTWNRSKLATHSQVHNPSNDNNQLNNVLN